MLSKDHFYHEYLRLNPTVRDLRAGLRAAVVQIAFFKYYDLMRGIRNHNIAIKYV